MAGGNGVLVPPHSGFGDDEAANPTDFLLVFGPLRTDLEMVGLVEIFQRREAAPQVQQGYLRFLVQMCELAGDFLKSHQLRHFSDRQVLWARLEDFTRTVHASLEPIETAYTIANEARRLIECDRVSVAIRKGNRCTIEAVSGQDVFDKRSNTVRLLGRLASAVVATGEPVWYAGDTRDLAPQVEDAVQEYVDDAHSKMIAVLPLGRPKPDEDADEQEKDDAEGAGRGADRRADRRQPRGPRHGPAGRRRLPAQFDGHGQRHGTPEPVPHAGVAGDRQEQVHRPGPHAAQDDPGRRGRAGGDRGLVHRGRPTSTCTPREPWSRSIAGTSTPAPKARSTNSATDVDGKPIEHGSWVKKGQLLLKLRNPTLNAQMVEIDGQVAIERQHVDDIAARTEPPAGRMKPDDQARLTGQLAEAQAEAEQPAGPGRDRQRPRWPISKCIARSTARSSPGT